MPSFRFRGFAEASLVALTVAQGAQAAQASVTWGQQVAGQPNASFSISRVDNNPVGEEIAPFGCWLRATNLVGFSVQEPPGDDNVYDPTQHRVTYVWELPDEGYQPILQPNIPNAFRQFTFDYGKQVAVVFTTPGVKTVRCFAFDDAGNWAVAEHVFGPGGQSNIIQDPEVYFLNKTVYVSQAGNWEGVPAGVPIADRVTTISAIDSRLNAFRNAGSVVNRILYRRGEVWDNLSSAPSGAGGSSESGGAVGAFGNPSLDRPRFVQRTNNGPFGYFGLNRRYCLLSDVEIIGPWDSTTETGRTLRGSRGTGNAWYQNTSVLLIHRVKWDGFDTIAMNAETPVNRHRLLHDTEVTNWKNFGIFEVTDKMSFIWCDLHQPEAALSGINGSSAGNSNAIYMGNLHGPVRGDPLWYHISRTSFFNRCGWSTAAPNNFISSPPTAGQPCLRYQGPAALGRAYVNVTMSSFEGTGDILRHIWFGSGVTPDNTQHNFVYDKNVICATAMTGTFSGSNYCGMTFRNNYLIWPDVPATRGAPVTGAISLGTSEWGSSAVLTVAAPDNVYNNTLVFLGPTSNVARPDNPNPTPTMTNDQNARRGTLTSENNLVLALDFTQPIGGEFAPVAQSPLTGFVPRYKGDRWNFPPIGIGAGPCPEITVGAARFRETGVDEAVLSGEWVAVDYPDYSQVCRGALAPLLATNTLRDLILANSTQRHQVSITNRGKIMVDGDLYPEHGEPRVKFEFLPDRIRIQNLSNETWTNGTPRIIVQLDLSDYLMDFAPGTASPASIPLLVPGVGSAGRVTEKLGLWAPDDFFGTPRPGASALGAVQP